jgi:hypothetical protein
MGEPEPQVMLEAVEATMSSPLLHNDPAKPDPAERDQAEPDPAPVVLQATLPGTPILPPTTVDRRVELELELAIVASVSVAASFVAADVRGVIVVGSLGLMAVGIRRIDRRVPFSFGEGFVGYRADLGWPHGVQEDDDIRWNWRASTDGPGSPATSQIPGSPPNRWAAER